MENLKTSIFFKSFVFRSKALVVRFFPLLALVTLALGLPVEGTLTPAKWHALVNGLFKGPAFAFLLLNCLIVTIIASSKLEGEKRGHREERKGLESMGHFNEKGCEKGDLVAEDVSGRELESHTPTQKGYDYAGSIRNNEKSFYQSINNSCCNEKSGLHEEDSNRELATGLNEKLGDEKADDVVDNVAEGGSHHNETPLRNGYDIHSKNKGGSYPRRSRSLNAKPYDYKPKNEQLKNNYVSEKKPIRSRDRLASRRNEKVRVHPNKPLAPSDLEKTQLIITRDSLVSAREVGSHPDPKPALQKSFDVPGDEKCEKGLGRAGNFVDNPAPDPAPATAHPSMEEVWAAICRQSSKRDNSTPSNMQAEKRISNEEPDSQTLRKPQPAAATAMPTQPVAAAAAALTPPAADSPTPPPFAAAAAASSRRAAKAALPKYWAGKAPVAEATEEGRELEELNRRAEKFIARFNGQIRLQREESLQRQKRPGRRTCNYERSYALQLPAPGLLVG